MVFKKGVLTCKNGEVQPFKEPEIDEYLAKPEEERKLYQAARRMARVVSPKEMDRLPTHLTNKIKKLIEATPDSYEWEIKMNEMTMDMIVMTMLVMCPALTTPKIAAQTILQALP